MPEVVSKASAERIFEALTDRRQRVKWWAAEGKFQIGDEIKLTESAFVALFNAFFAQIEAKCTYRVKWIGQSHRLVTGKIESALATIAFRGLFGRVDGV